MTSTSQFIRLCLLIFGFFPLVSVSSAQTQRPGNNNQKDNPTYTFEFSVYPIGKANWKEIYYQEEPGIYKTLTFWSFERSPKYSYEGSLPIEFYRKETQVVPGKDPITTYRPVTHGQPNPKSDENLFFFVPSGNEQTKEFQLIALDESKRSFPLDTLTFVNATGANLEGVFGNKPIFIKQGISTPYDLKKHYKKETMIGLAVQFEGQMQKVLHSKWSFYPNYREIILLLPPKKSGSMRIQAFRITQHKEEIDPPKANLRR